MASQVSRRPQLPQARHLIYVSECCVLWPGSFLIERNGSPNCFRICRRRCGQRFRARRLYRSLHILVCGFQLVRCSRSHQYRFLRRRLHPASGRAGVPVAYSADSCHHHRCDNHIHCRSEAANNQYKDRDQYRARPCKHNDPNGCQQCRNQNDKDYSFESRWHRLYRGDIVSTIAVQGSAKEA